MPAGTGHRSRSAVRRRVSLRAEAGQSLVILVLSMFVIIAIAAVAIDLSSWYQKHHRAQVSADAAALAAANCEAAGTCNNTTGTQTAVNYVKTNSGVTIPTNDVQIANQTVTVTTPLQSSSFFAAAVSALFGNTTQTAVAKASWKIAGTNCTTTGGRCAFIFANDNSCSGPGVTINTSGSSGAVTGTVISNAGISWSASGNPGGTAYATENVNCGGATGSNWAGKTTYSVSPYWPNDWPINYANIYSPCGTGMSFSCGASGTPSYCTDTAVAPTGGGNFGGTSGVALNGNQFYCAVGTGTPSNPATWNGSITIPSSFTGTNATFIGGSISISTKASVAPYTRSALLAYATGTGDSSTCSANAISLTGDGNTGTVSGDVFAPNGGACVNIGGNETYSGFIQANDVWYSSNGTDTGDGPITSATGGDPSPPVDSLTG